MKQIPPEPRSNQPSGNKKSSNKKNSKKSSKGKQVRRIGESSIKTLFFGIGKFVLGTFLVLVIILSIVGTAMTVFIMNYIESEGIDLSNAEIFSNSLITATNEDGEQEVIQKLKTGGRQAWVSIDQMPQHLQDAFVFTEDKRFMDHEGVDWRRTIVSFVRLMLAGDNSQGGGSTISQQLIKNINKDFAAETRTVETKMKEILAALQLERHNSKPKILEAYLNYINLGKGNTGVQAAAKFYFNKDVSELTIAESAALAATTQSPENLNIIADPQRNKDRRNAYTITQMYEGERISTEAFEAAKKETLEAYDWGDKEPLEEEGENKIYSWYVDNVIRQVYRDLRASDENMTDQVAWGLINGGGLQIETPVDLKMQKELEEFFLNDKNFYSSKVKPHPPEAAMTVMDYDGYVQATVGSRNEKEAKLAMDRATKDPRSPGSTMKPIATYAPAIDSDLITWSTMLKDEPKVKMGRSSTKNWPRNFDRTYRGMVTIEYALRKSLNTIPVDLLMQMGIDRSYNFLQDDLHISTLGAQNDRSYNLTLGMNDTGLFLDELAAAYTIFGNDGMYNSPKYYTRVRDMHGTILLDQQPENNIVIGADSAYVMNKLLQQVVTAEGGTGVRAKLRNGIEVAGKTGTSDGAYERSFVGMTPYHVSAIRLGYDQNDKKVTGSSRNLTYRADRPEVIWQRAMTKFLKDYDAKTFDEVISADGVTQRAYCTTTGLLAGSSCPRGTGWYKDSNMPHTCNLAH